jgi:WD40 repeat protein/tRNA A-37 threonylcarbamoyl transferase component Bud32
MIRLPCPACQKTVEVSDPLDDKTIRCPHCSERLSPSPAESGADTATVPPSGRNETDGTIPTLPGYEILEVLGRGGMGVVYKARQIKLDRTVALKMILSGGHAGEADLARFRTEAEAVARLQHAGIVQIFEIGSHQGLPYFSLEFVEGGSLEKELAKTPLPPQQAARLVQRLAEAIHTAHEHQIIHRDLKPANVLLSADRQPKITDFGLAKKLDAAGQTQTGAVMGTPSYMAPEQAGGKSKEIGPATDVYALGAILYECLTGRPPFKAATPLDTLLQVVADDPVPPRQLQPKVPADLETICLKCLAKEPAKRYGSAEALAEELRRFLSGEPIKARPAGVLERGVKWARRRPAVAGLLTVSVLALVTLISVGVYFTTELAAEVDRAERAERDALRKAEAESRAKKDAQKARNDAERLAKEESLAKQDAQKARNVAQQLAKEEKAARDRAEEEKRAAKYQALRAESARHAMQLYLALWAWEQHDVVEAEHILGEVDGTFQHSWEQGHLRNLCHRKALSLYGHSSPVRSLAISADGKCIVSGSDDGIVKVWDAATGREKYSLKAHTGAILSVAISADGKRIVSGGGGFDPKTKQSRGEVKVWDAVAGQAKLSLKGHTGHVYSVAFSLDGTRIVSGGGEESLVGAKAKPGEVKVWDAATGQEKLCLKGHILPVRSVAISADGQRMASGGGGADWRKPGEVKVWDAATGQEKLSLQGHTNGVSSVAFSADGTRLVSGSWDQTVKVWDAQTGQALLTLKGHTFGVSSVAFSGDGRRLVSGSADKTVKVWDVQTGQNILTLKGHNGTVYSVAFSGDGKRVISGGGAWDSKGKLLHGEVKVWDTATGQEKLTLKGHTGPVTSVGFSADGQRIVSGSDDKTVKVWDAATGQEKLTLKGHTLPVRSVAISGDGQRMASGGGADWRKPGEVKVWDAATGQEQLSLKGHTGGVFSVAFSPGGTRIVSGSSDNTVRVWDAATGQEKLSLKGHTNWVLGVVFSAAGQLIVSGGEGLDGEVKMWDAATGQEKLSLKGHTLGVTSVAFSADGQRIASGSFDRTVKVWDTATGQEKLSLKGHTGAVTSVAFSSDGQRIASGSSDQTVKVWDVATGQEKLSLKGHTNGVTSVAFSPDGTRIVSGGRDWTVKVWEADLDGK